MGRVSQQLSAAFLELGPACARPDGDPVSASLADGLDDKLLQVVERVAECLRLAADVGLDIGQDRILAEIVADHARHIGVDSLVVSDAGTDRIRERDVPTTVGAHQTRDPERTVGAENLWVQELVVDAPVNNIDRHEASDGVHIDPVIADHEVGADNELYTHLPREEHVLEESGVERSW
jgi:hypothetical protein